MRHSLSLRKHSEARKNVRAELSLQGLERCFSNIIPLRYYKYYIATKRELRNCRKSGQKNDDPSDMTNWVHNFPTLPQFLSRSTSHYCATVFGQTHTVKRVVCAFSCGEAGAHKHPVGSTYKIQNSKSKNS